MPVSVKQINRLHRIVEPSGKIAKTKTGRARDGGGHATREEALRQMRAMNSKYRNRMLA